VGIEERPESVRRLAARPADTLFRPAAVVDRVIRLHRRDHAHASKPRDIRRPDVLRVLDSESPIPRSVLPSDPFEEVKQLAIGSVADRVDLDL
jgi:hypothetical protein